MALRVEYAACYIADLGKLRSTVWLSSQVPLAVLALVALSMM